MVTFCQSSCFGIKAFYIGQTISGLVKMGNFGVQGHIFSILYANANKKVGPLANGFIKGSCFFAVCE